MKRITSTLLVAALPTLAALSNWAPGWVPGPGTVIAQRGGGPPPGAQEGEAPPAGSAEAEEDDDVTAPDGFDPKSRTGFDVFGRRTKVRGNTFEDRLQGGWRLVRMNLSGSNPRGRQAQGFLHIGPSFLSMEIHALWEDAGGAAIPESDIHTTFTAEYQIDSGGKLFCSTVIGSFIDEETGELRWERTGYERQYRVREILNQIELSFTDETNGQSLLIFEPYLPRTRGQKDIFGRNEAGSFGATDIFGRPNSGGSGERDIYGRPIEAPEGTGEKPEKGPELPPKGAGAGGAPLSGRGGY